MHRLWLFLGALVGLAAVALSAWAAHGAPAGFATTPRRAVDNALMIQGWHAFALLAAGLMAERGSRLAHLAGAAFAIGTALFCGAVWWGVLGHPSLGPVAPTGGMTLMAGWALLAVAALKR
ncbi:DUF423 domain-containing protein [Neoroseomonas lacus]|uniref:DUF423 domain-containing protein n=1 Tax=Neoroseomonas lacus TaxID=287609 RepID=A0A917KCB6_9PROT|nr:DUF423 domain-containing protein [Neoroseomonas lacus]GGJ06560.1 hypothetical protein GCM10011320_11770 [Neoroseomonas lacus]